jgi:hypothetical protein
VSDLADHGQARHTDPVTSKDAAKKTRPGPMHRKLLAAHAKNPAGMTDEEAALAAGIPLASEYATRCSELQNRGYLRGTKETRRGESGMARIVRVITDKGLLEVDPGYVPVTLEPGFASDGSLLEMSVVAPDIPRGKPKPPAVWHCGICKSVVPTSSVMPSSLDVRFGEAKCQNCGRLRPVRRSG